MSDEKLIEIEDNLAHSIANGLLVQFMSIYIKNSGLLEDLIPKLKHLVNSQIDSQLETTHDGNRELLNKVRLKALTLIDSLKD